MDGNASVNSECEGEEEWTKETDEITCNDEDLAENEDTEEEANDWIKGDENIGQSKETSVWYEPCRLI